MKTKFLFILVFVTGLKITNAQITITRADMPCPSAGSCGQDSVIFTSVPIAQNTIDIVPTGASSVWNILPLQNGTSAYQKFLPVSMTPIVFQLVFFGADFAQPLLGNVAVAGLPVTDAYEYYNYAAADSRLEIKGFGAYLTLGGNPVPVPAIYSSADVIYRFPMNYGDMDSSVSAFSVDVPPVSPIATVKRDQKRVNQVDGWGSITTPAGVFDVLRVKSDITRVDSVITGFVPFGAATNPVEYKWIGNTKKIPVLQVNGNVVAGNFTPTTITFWGIDPTAVPGHFSLDAAMQLSPNPATSGFSLQFTLTESSEVDIELLSLNGSHVGSFHLGKLQPGQHTEYIPVHLLPPGNYTIKCSTLGQTISTKLLKL